MSKPMKAADALEFVRLSGIVLASAKGGAPRLIEAILGEPITGNWWTHPRASFICNVLSSACDSQDVLVCRLLRGRITLVHRRLWPSLVRLSHRIDPKGLAWVRNEHLPSGRHASTEVPYPDWVPASAHAQAALLSEEQAMAALGPAVARDLSFRGGPR
jgi:hypothetical protein